jgi:hypothetical protein
MADDHWVVANPVDDLRHVGGDFVDSDVCDLVRVRSSFRDRGRLVRPAWGEGLVTGVPEPLEPG